MTSTFTTPIVVREAPSCYYIRSKTSNLVLEVEKGNYMPKAYAIMGNKVSDSDTVHDHQLWYFEDAGDGFVYIVSRLSGLVLDIKGHSHSSGANLILYPRKPPPQVLTNQKWKLIDGFITSQLNEMVVGIKGNGKTGSRVATFPRASASCPHQQWVFEKAQDNQHDQPQSELVPEESTGADDDDQPRGESIGQVWQLIHSDNSVLS